MPALVNSSVGSLAGKSGLERTRVWPCCSKYCKNFSRISLPVMISLKFSTRGKEIHHGGHRGSVLVCYARDGVSTGSGPGSPRGQPAWGGGCDRVAANRGIMVARVVTRSLPLPVLT